MKRLRNWLKRLIRREAVRDELAGQTGLDELPPTPNVGRWSGVWID